MKSTRSPRAGASRGRNRPPAVHLSTIRRRYKDKVYECHLLRRTIREGKKVRNETVANLSALPDAVIEVIRRALAGEVLVPVSEAVETGRTLPAVPGKAVPGTTKKLEHGSRRSRSSPEAPGMLAEDGRAGPRPGESGDTRRESTMPTEVRAGHPEVVVQEGPWIEVVPPEEATGRLAEVYAEVAGRRGEVAGVLQVQSLDPEALRAHVDLYVTLMFGRSPLTRREREMIGVVVSRSNGCAYCIEHHADALARYEKASEVILALRAGRWESLSPRDQAICRFAEALTLFPGKASRADVEALRDAGLDDAGILAITEVAAYFNFVNRLVLGLGVRLEPVSSRKGFRY